MDPLQPNVPIVDLQSVGIWSKHEPTPAALDLVGKLLVKALTDVGFVYVSNHGIVDDAVQRAYKAGIKFFNLSEEQKKELLNEDFHGYLPLHKERLLPTHEYSPHEIVESFFVRDLAGKFPDSAIPEFRPVLCALTEQMQMLAKRLLQALDYGLGVVPGFFPKHHCSGTNRSVFKILHYPPIAADAPPNAVWFREHVDLNTVTILHQEDMAGLEVQEKKSGQRVAAPIIPGAFLVIAGTMLERWTNGAIMATKHRVVVPASRHAKPCSRRSIAYFAGPNNETNVTPLDGNEETYPTINYKDFIDTTFAVVYAEP